MKKEEHINILFNALKHSKERFDHYFEIFTKSFENKKLLFNPADIEHINNALELYSFNCIKIEYELLTNPKIDFLNILRNNPAEKLFVYEGLPAGLITMYDLLDKKKTKNITEGRAITAIDDLDRLRNKVVCHCDPDNYELLETLKLHNEKADIGQVTDQHILFLKKRKEVIDKYFSLLNPLIAIINSNY